MYGLGKVKTKRQLNKVATFVFASMLSIGVVWLILTLYAGPAMVRNQDNTFSPTMICVGSVGTIVFGLRWFYYWMLERNIRSERR